MAAQVRTAGHRRRVIGGSENAEASRIYPSFTGKITINSIDQSRARLRKQYDLLAHKFNELYLAGKERGNDAIEAALEKAREQLTSLGKFSAQQGEDLKRHLARDLYQTMAHLEELAT